MGSSDLARIHTFMLKRSKVRGSSERLIKKYALFHNILIFVLLAVHFFLINPIATRPVVTLDNGNPIIHVTLPFVFLLFSEDISLVSTDFTFSGEEKNYELVFQVFGNSLFIELVGLLVSYLRIMKRKSTVSIRFLIWNAYPENSAEKFRLTRILVTFLGVRKKGKMIGRVFQLAQNFLFGL